MGEKGPTKPITYDVAVSPRKKNVNGRERDSFQSGLTSISPRDAMIVFFVLQLVAMYFEGVNGTINILFCIIFFKLNIQIFI